MLPLPQHHLCLLDLQVKPQDKKHNRLSCGHCNPRQATPQPLLLPGYELHLELAEGDPHAHCWVWGHARMPRQVHCLCQQIVGQRLLLPVGRRMLCALQVQPEQLHHCVLLLDLWELVTGHLLLKLLCAAHGMGEGGASTLHLAEGLPLAGHLRTTTVYQLFSEVSQALWADSCRVALK